MLSRLPALMLFPIRHSIKASVAAWNDLENLSFHTQTAVSFNPTHVLRHGCFLPLRPAPSFHSTHSSPTYVWRSTFRGLIQISRPTWVLGKQVKPEVQEDSSLLCKGWTGTMACVPHQRKGWATINLAFRLLTDFTFTLKQDFLKWIEMTTFLTLTQCYQDQHLSLL